MQNARDIFSVKRRSHELLVKATKLPVLKLAQFYLHNIPEVSKKLVAVSFKWFHRSMPSILTWKHANLL